MSQVANTRNERGIASFLKTVNRSHRLERQGNHSSVIAPRAFRELPFLMEQPPCCRRRKFLLPHPETYRRLQIEYRFFQREQFIGHFAQFPFVLLLIPPNELANALDLALGFNHALEDHRFVGSFRAHRAMRILCQVPRLSRGFAGAEIEPPILPERPDDHYVWTPVRAGCCNPVLPALLQSILRPAPGKEAFLSPGKAVAWNVRARRFGSSCFDHRKIVPRRA